MTPVCACCSPGLGQGQVWEKRQLLLPLVLAARSAEPEPDPKRGWRCAPCTRLSAGGAARSPASPLPAAPALLSAQVVPPSPLTRCLLSLPVFLSVNNLPQTPSTFTITTCHILHPTTAITTVTPR